MVELADVVIQVLDARDPLGCRCPDVERYIRSVNPGKRIILLLNKVDLVPREAGERWLKCVRRAPLAPSSCFLLLARPLRVLPLARSPRRGR